MDLEKEPQQGLRVTNESAVGALLPSRKVLEVRVIMAGAFESGLLGAILRRAVVLAHDE